jgi:hypothetical protein
MARRDLSLDQQWTSLLGQAGEGMGIVFVGAGDLRSSGSPLFPRGQEGALNLLLGSEATTAKPVACFRSPVHRRLPGVAESVFSALRFKV